MTYKEIYQAKEILEDLALSVAEGIDPCGSLVDNIYYVWDVESVTVCREDRDRDHLSNVSVPASVLEGGVEAADIYVAEVKEKQARKERDRSNRRAAQAREAERIQYEALRKKFEGM